ncbi:MAG: thioredoxin family protein [Chromatiales bacterium]|nr:thioredoxin family protein [Chromatiales bacterium]
MKHVKVLGTGCRNCQTTLNADRRGRHAPRASRSNWRRSSRSRTSCSIGLMATPGVVIDEEVVHSGGVPDRKKIERWFAPSA